MFKQYLKIFILVLCGLGLPCGVNALFLYFSGELLPVSTITKMQEGNPNHLAGFATHDLTYFYKLETYKTIQADIIAIGSSRVLPFRREMFSKTFFNFGRAMNSIDQGYFLVDEILKIHTPKVVILGLDFWWFVGNAKENIQYYIPPKDNTTLSLKLLMQPYLWLYQNKISWDYYIKTLFKPLYGAFIPHIGVHAQMKNEGFAHDGSYYYTSVVTGAAPSDDIQFQTSLLQIQEGKGQYQHNQKISPIYIERFLRMIEKLQENGVKVMVFIPPVSPTIVEGLEKNKDKFEYITDLFSHLKTYNITLFDFHNAADIKACDCEFLDGYHGGEVLYLRMLDKMATEENNKALLPFVNMPYITSTIAQYRNRFATPHSVLSTLPEIDFLQIGCKKTDMS